MLCGHHIDDNQNKDYYLFTIKQTEINTNQVDRESTDNQMSSILYNVSSTMSIIILGKFVSGEALVHPEHRKKIAKCPLWGHRYLGFYTPYGCETCTKVSFFSLVLQYDIVNEFYLRVDTGISQPNCTRAP